MDSRDLKFPIICFSKQNILHFARNYDDITICSKVALKNGFYKNLQIIDSDSLYTIINAKQINTVGPFLDIIFFSIKK